MSNRDSKRDETIAQKTLEKLRFLPEVFMYYYAELQAQEKSYKTIAEYVISVNQFMNYFLGSEKDEFFYKRVTTEDISTYMVHLETRVVGDETKSTSSSFRIRQWYALNSFFEFLLEQGVVDTNPVLKDCRPKNTDTRQTTFLTKKEISGIISEIKKSSNLATINRDLCLFMLGVTTGLHVSAILQINVDDVDMEKGVISVIENRKRSFEVLIGSKLKETIKQWLVDREHYFEDVKTDALFLSKFGQRLSYESTREMIAKYAKDVTVKKVTPNVLRNSCATNLYEKTGDILLTSAQLHHSSISLTQRYAKVVEDSKEKMQKAADILDDLV